MRRFLTFGFVFGLALVLTFPKPIQAQTAPKWATDHLSAWYKAFNAGDAAGITHLYTPAAVRIPPGRDRIRGRAAIEAELAGEFAKARYDCVGAYDGFQVVGDLAVGWGHDTCTSTSKSDGTTESTKERWLSAFERQSSGEWLIVRETWENLNP